MNINHASKVYNIATKEILK